MKNPGNDTEEKAMEMIIDAVLDLISATSEPELHQMLMFRCRLLSMELEIMRLNKIVSRLSQ